MIDGADGWSMTRTNVHARQEWVGLQPGTYTVRAERDGESIVEAVAQVQARSVARVQLTLPKTSGWTHAVGTIRIPEAWNDPGGHIECTPLRPGGGFLPQRQWNVRAVQVEGSNEDLWHFEGRAWSGESELYIPRLNFTTRITVSPDGSDKLHVDVPAPGHLSLQVIDRLTREGVLSDLTLLPAVDGDSSGESFSTRDSETGRFEIVAPVGLIRIVFGGEDLYATTTRTLQISPGFQTDTFELTRGGSIDLKFESGGVSAWLPDEAPRVSGPGELLEVNLWGDSHWILVDAPGRYTIEMPALDDYQTVPPIELDVTIGKTTHHTIQLEPR